MANRKSIFKLEASIRIVFSSLMLVPLILLIYFTLHFSQSPNCLALYFKNQPKAAAKLIAWPDNGLLTLWFDGDYFAKNKNKIMALMNKYHFPGVISLSDTKSCRAQSLSISELMMLHNQNWEITNTSPFVEGEHAINDMPAPNRRKQVIYDMSSNKEDATFTRFIKETSLRNGWMILYFHSNSTSQVKKTRRIDELNHILNIVKYSGVPVVLQEQVLTVSQ